MTDTINDVAEAPEQVQEEPATPVDQQRLAERLLVQAKEQASSWSARTGCCLS